MLSAVVPAILELDQVSKHFDTAATPAVDRVSFALQQGDVLSLLGPSGCGKTTLLRLIAGFERPQSGHVLLAGRPVVAPGVWVPPERRDVGVVFQDYALFPHLSVWENIAFGLKTQRRRGQGNTDKIADEVCRAIALVGLTGLEKRFPHELSGGQQQRVALARAIAPRPTLILLDEPFSNLDVQVRLHLRQEVREILKSVGTSGIFVTHDQEEALSIADQLAVMQAGKLEQWGTPETIYQSPQSRFVAGFVTQANFVPAERQGAMWQTPLGNFPVLPHHPNCPQADLMVRQEALQLRPDPMGRLVVRDRQFLGREYRYTLSTGTGHTLYARTPTPVQVAIGQTVEATLTAESLMVFPVTPHESV